MPRELFRGVSAPPSAARSRRSSIVLLSGLGHAAAAVVLLAASLAATVSLPAPRQPLAFVDQPRLVRVDVELPPSPPPARSTPAPASSADAPAAAHAAPLVAPDAIAPQTGLEGAAGAVDRSALGIVEAGAGLVPGLGVMEAPPPPPPPAAPVRLHSGIQAPQKLVAEPPVYPPAARSARIEGVVILEAIIDAAGRVQSVRVLRSVPMLDQAAIAAVERWRFTPARFNERPIPVTMTVTVSFTLKP